LAVPATGVASGNTGRCAATDPGHGSARFPDPRLYLGRRTMDRQRQTCPDRVTGPDRRNNRPNGHSGVPLILGRSCQAVTATPGRSNLPLWGHGDCRACPGPRIACFSQRQRKCRGRIASGQEYPSNQSLRRRLSRTACAQSRLPSTQPVSCSANRPSPVKAEEPRVRDRRAAVARI
jgi:hypothetical protein